MTIVERDTLLALIKGLTTYENVSQRYEGDKVINERNIKILENIIKNMSHNEEFDSYYRSADTCHADAYGDLFSNPNHG